MATLKEALDRKKIVYSRTDLQRLGKIVNSAWKTKYPGQIPAKVSQIEGTKSLEVFSYPIEFMGIINRIIKFFYKKKDKILTEEKEMQRLKAERKKAREAASQDEPKKKKKKKNTSLPQVQNVVVPDKPVVTKSIQPPVPTTLNPVAEIPVQEVKKRKRISKPVFTNNRKD